MEEDKNIRHLLHSVQLISDQAQALEKAKGETFNVFSILRMESKENDTHSNFLGNLLDPNGTHLMESVFLKLFLEEINGDKILKDLDSVEVVLEHYCGRVNNTTKTGGRIDIYLKDVLGSTISIENKIYAGDQPHQIERYVNHNKSKNAVYYLTLFGDNPSEGSRGKLEGGKDFFTISYKREITNWLNKCIKEAANEPIVRETIKQYRILIQKLTNSMEGKNKEDLQQLILKNYSTAELIARNFDQAKESICNKLREGVLSRLNAVLSETPYEAGVTTKITTSYAQVWIWNKNNHEAKICFGIEPFGSNASSKFFVGTFTYGDDNFEKLDSVERYNQYWSNLDFIPSIDGVELRMNNSVLIKKIAESNEYLNRVVDHITEFFMSYFSENKELVENYLIKITPNIN